MKENLELKGKGGTINMNNKTPILGSQNVRG